MKKVRWKREKDLQNTKLLLLLLRICVYEKKGMP